MGSLPAFFETNIKQKRPNHKNLKNIYFLPVFMY